MNRKLIRPNFTDVKNKERDPIGRNSTGGKPDGYGLHKPTGTTRPPALSPGADGASSALHAGKGKKVPPPVETNAEVYYYKKQIDTHTRMVIVLQDGEEIEGTIEWYDRNALKINCTKGRNLMLFKHNIKYMFKAEDRKPATDDRAIEK